MDGYVLMVGTTLCCVGIDISFSNTPVLFALLGQQLAECSLYGIRIYKEGAVLATHVDRLPLVSSAIINVDQDGTHDVFMLHRLLRQAIHLL